MSKVRANNNLNNKSHISTKLHGSAGPPKKLEIEKYTRAVFETFLNDTSAILMITDRKAIPVWVNNAWVSMFGAEPKADENYFKFVHPDDLKEVRNKWSRIVRKGYKVEDLIYRYQLGENHFITLETSIYPVKLDGFTGYFFSSRDISTKKFFEAELIKTESILKKSERLACTGSWEWDLETDLLTLSDNWRKIHGVNSSKIFLDDFYALFETEEKQKLTDAFIACLDDNLPLVLEYEIHNSQTGLKRLIKLQAEVLRNKNGAPIKMYGVSQDVTDIKVYEQNLLETEQKLKLAMTSAGQGMWDWDVESEKVTIDRKIMEITGFLPDEIDDEMGKEDWWRNRIHDDDKKNVAAKIENFVSGKTESFNIEYRFKTKKGIYIWVAVTGQAFIKNEEGKPRCVIGIFKDIDSRKKLENHLTRLNSQLKTKNKQMEKMLFATSHDLRSPLVNIQGFSMELKSALLEMDSILKSGEISETTAEVCSFILNEEIPDLFNYILQNTEKMDALLTGIALISKLERQNLVIEKINMNTVIGEVLREFEPQLEEKNIDVDLFDLPPCYGDQSLVVKLFANLIGNAIKFSDPFRNSEIKIYSTNKNRMLYHVKDNGIGLPSAFKNKIFDLFYQIDSTQPGLGIGLTIAKLIIERLNGEITVDSIENEGTCFNVFLPQH